MLEKLEGPKCATAYTGNCIIEARFDLAKQTIKLRNLDIEVAITIASSLGHYNSKKLLLVLFLELSNFCRVSIYRFGSEQFPHASNKTDC